MTKENAWEDASLFEKLKAYGESGAYPFHMPGHKRNEGNLGNPYDIDITEIDGFDDLHHARGILKEAQERAARLYGSDETRFLVNGSTAGILAAVSTLCRGPAPRLLVARNCHRSVYHGLYLNRAGASYLFPEPAAAAPSVILEGGITAGAVRRALDDMPQGQPCCGVVITSPTYEGVLSEVEEIAQVAHERGIPLLVDEAHGAHFGLTEDLPPSAVRLGADLVVQSMHKTLPSLTQTALLHVNGNLVDRERLDRFLKIYQTSSPSYVLMAGMDQCIRALETNRQARIKTWLDRLESLRRRCKDLTVMTVTAPGDPGRLLIGASGRLSGVQICDMLRNRFSLEPEMAGDTYAVCISTLSDTQDGFDALERAVRVMDGELAGEPDRELTGRLADRTSEEPAKGHLEGFSGGLSKEHAQELSRKAEAVMNIHEAWDAPAERTPLAKSAGCILGDFVYLYPPGTPLLAPGERMTSVLAARLEAYHSAGYTLHGVEEENGVLTVRTVKT